MSALVDLRPNRNLMANDFEGYKLNLQALPHYVHELILPVDRVYPDEVQYSFIHAKLFALHNHLVSDKWDYAHNYYYVDKKQQVRHIHFDTVSSTFTNRVVYDIPAHEVRKSGHFNLSVAFPSGNIAVVSGGTGFLHIVDTGDRNKSSNFKWQTLHSALVLGEGKYFVLIDVRVKAKNDVEILHCLLQSVEHIDNHFHSILTWVQFLREEKSWKLTSMKQLQGKGIVHYAVLETTCEALYVATDNPFKFTIDSEKEIVATTDANRSSKKYLYTWLQTSEDITLSVRLDSNIDKKLLAINVSSNTIAVGYAGNTYIEGKFKYTVDSDLTTWNVKEDGQVDILVTKSESMLWDELIEGGDIRGEQIMDASLVEEAHQRLSHLCSETEAISDNPITGLSTQELEECDAASEEDTLLVRFNLNHEVTHRIPLSVHQYLFNITIEAAEVPALVLRHDVDACVWQPYAQIVNSSTWPVQHHGTLPAFGYVQSSKQNRKFLACSPDFSYSVVCEASRHLFIYDCKNDKNCQLRKRAGGTLKNVKFGQQHVFNIDKYGEVLGINANNDILFILTENNLVALLLQ